MTTPDELLPIDAGLDMVETMPVTDISRELAVEARLVVVEGRADVDAEGLLC